MKIGVGVFGVMIKCPKNKIESVEKNNLFVREREREQFRSSGGSCVHVRGRGFGSVQGVAFLCL